MFDCECSPVNDLELRFLIQYMIRKSDCPMWNSHFLYDFY